MRTDKNDLSLCTGAVILILRKRKFSSDWLCKNTTDEICMYLTVSVAYCLERSLCVRYVVVRRGSDLDWIVPRPQKLGLASVWPCARHNDWSTETLQCGCNLRRSPGVLLADHLKTNVCPGDCRRHNFLTMQITTKQFEFTSVLRAHSSIYRSLLLASW